MRASALRRIIGSGAAVLALLTRGAAAAQLRAAAAGEAAAR